jgi:hypothetical protein
MASYQDQLISRIIREGRAAYQKTKEFGISYEDIPSGMPSSIWKTVDEYFTSIETAGSIPGEATVSTQFPQFQMCDDVGMTLDALCWEVRKERIRRETKALLVSAEAEATINPILALSTLNQQLKGLIELGAPRRTDVDFRSEFSHVLADYEAQERGDYISVAPWPWESLQNQTGGLAKDDFIVFYGRPKSMKTWVFCYLLAHLFENGKSVLLYTKEMTPRNIFKRMASIIAKVPYQELRTGKLSPGDYSCLRDVYHLINNPKTNPMIALSAKDVPNGGDTVSWLRSKVERYKPEVVGIDGMYLMSDGRGGKSADWV